ncbi:related to SYF2 - pre-mRNA-splicing factor [Ustilago sp. UG-2017b]|nr:related to SYF2 - pre-mRNA-splicing factor [Ustilago sp. UG-2017b]
MPPRRTRAAKEADGHYEATPEVKVAELFSSTTASHGISAETERQPSTAPTKLKAKAKAARNQPLLPDGPSTSTTTTTTSSSSNPEPPPTPPSAEATRKPTMEDRQARLSTLRSKMAASTRANRHDILSEQSRSRSLASKLKNPSTSRKLAKAESLLEQRDLRESGEDVERHRNMTYSLEDDEKWDKKLQQKETRKDQGTSDFGNAAQRAYQRQVRLLKPNIAEYQKEKEERAKTYPNSPPSKPLVRKPKGTIENYAARVGEEAEEIHYGTHRPSDDAMDRVVQHLNHEKQVIQNRSRRREEQEDAEVNYINDGNKHFNKKLKRFYDKETKEIRENLERGTAL